MFELLEDAADETVEQLGQNVNGLCVISKIEEMHGHKTRTDSEAAENWR